MTSLPPITLYVGGIPLALTREGLANLFTPHGDILRVELLRGKDGRTNFGFVTFCRRPAALSAIENIHKKPPLNMVVNYKMGEREKAERQEKEVTALQFAQKWEVKEGKKEPEKEQDYDEEIAMEEKMEEEVNKFLQDSSDEDWAMLPVLKQDEVRPEFLEDDAQPKMPPCARCGRSSEVRCSGCRVERYCGPACQSLEWPRHKERCSRVGFGNQVTSNEANLASGDKKSPEEKKTNGKKTEVFEEKKKCGFNGNIETKENAAGRLLRCEQNITQNEDLPETTKQLVKTNRSESDDGEFLTLQEVLHSSPEKDLSEEQPHIKCLTNRRLEELEVPTHSSESRGNTWCSRPAHSDSVEDLPGVPPASQVQEEGIYTLVDVKPFDLEEPDCVVELLSLDPGTMVGMVRSPEGLVLLPSLLAECCPSSSLLGSPPIPGQLVAALSSSGSYLRAVVEEVVKETQQVVCSPVDGLEEKMTRHLSSLSPLPPSCLLVPLLAQKVRLSTTVPQSDIGSTFHLAVNCRASSADPLPLVLLTPVNQPAPTAPSVKSSSQSDRSQAVRSEESLRSSLSSFGCMELQVGRVQKVTVLHVESPHAVYLCPDQPALKKLQSHIYSTAVSLSQDLGFRPEIGVLVLAKSVQDDNWYRALVHEVQEDGITAFFPDFGFKEEVEMDMVRAVNKRLFVFRQKFLACRCILEEWVGEEVASSQREIRNLKKLIPVSADQLSVAVVEKKGASYIIRVSDQTNF